LYEDIVEILNNLEGMKSDKQSHRKSKLILH